MRQPFGTQLVAGDSWSWNITLPEYSAADGFVLKYFFRGTSKIDVVSEAGPDGRSFQFDKTSDDTKDLAPGAYGWTCVIVDGADNRQTLASGGIDILPNLEAQDVNYDGRSWARRSLDHAQAVAENRASRIDLEYSVGGRMLKTLTPDQLLKLIADLQNIVRRELRDGGQLGNHEGDIQVRFGRE